MQYNNILSQTNENICIVTINRESKLNALNIATLQEIKHAIESGNANKDVHGFILTGAGTKAFAAGADISEFANFTVDQGTKMSSDGHAVMNTIENSSKPVIAAVNGFALGGGCELAMACHLRIASSNAKFGQPEVNLGVPPGYGGTQRLIQLIGKSKATELLLTADIIKADVALQLGLVNYVVEQDDLLNQCAELLRKITSKSPMAVAVTLQCVNAYYKHNGFETEIDVFGKAFGTADFKTGTQAFLNKEAANFRD